VPPPPSSPSSSVPGTPWLHLPVRCAPCSTTDTAEEHRGSRYTSIYYYFDRRS
jgi:hypothetical protein